MRIFKTQQGFTLMELMVAMAIMGIMVVITTPRYMAYKRAKSMSYARTQIENDVRYIQDSTLSGMKFPGESFPPKGGYGIHFQKNTSSFLLFGDKDQGASAPNHVYSSAPVPELLETVNLPQGVVVSDVKVVDNSGATTSPYSIDFVCLPPYGKVYIGSSANNSYIELTIKLNGESTGHAFRINSSGYISDYIN